MSETKVLGANVAIVLGIMCVVLVGGLVAAVASYTAVINSKDAAHQDYVSIHTRSNDEYDALSDTYQAYMGTHSHSNAEYDGSVANLQAATTALQDANNAYSGYVADHHHTDEEFNSVAAPHLVAVNLNGQDLGSGLPLLGTPVLHVYGSVCNVGTYAAYNSQIHVVAYRYDVKVVDTYITLGTMYGSSWKTVDANFAYSGNDALTYWTMTPQWTTTP